MSDPPPSPQNFFLLSLLGHLLNKWPKIVGLLLNPPPPFMEVTQIESAFYLGSSLRSSVLMKRPQIVFIQ